MKVNSSPINFLNPSPRIVDWLTFGSFVRSVSPDTTIIRPATLFCTEDTLLNGPAQQASMYNRVFLVNGGNGLRKPVFALDMAEAIVNAMDDTTTQGQTLSFAGDDEWSLKEIAEYVLEVSKQEHCKREEISEGIHYHIICYHYLSIYVTLLYKLLSLSKYLLLSFKCL